MQEQRDNVIIQLLKSNETKLDKVLERQRQLELNVAVFAEGQEHTTKRFDEELAGLKATIKEEIEPQIANFKKIKNAGLGAGVFFTSAGISVGGFLAWVGKMFGPWSDGSGP